MPELPEVEVVVQSLRGQLAGARLTAARFSGKRLRHAFPQQAIDRLIGEPLQNVTRRAKFVILEFPSGWLAIHLGMSGAAQVCDRNVPSEMHDHVRLGFLLPNQQVCDLVYNDPRRFGSFQWFEKSQVSDVQALGALLGESAKGIEPFDPCFDGRLLFSQSRGSRAAVKPWLMQGSTVVGVGNIYACEALFASGIHPARAAGAISSARYERLATVTRDILRSAIEAGGSTIRDFVSADGAPGRYGQAHQVYGREGRPCSKCARPIRRIVQQQRSTFYCYGCQR
jgi:formamidopyrimidine-DNA glycosylase